jgi:hypothetical protein
MLDRPSQQELIQLVELQRTRLTPPEITGHRSQMVCAGLVPLPVGAKLTHRDLSAFRQARDSNGRSRGDFVWDESQPRQRT